MVVPVDLAFYAASVMVLAIAAWNPESAAPTLTYQQIVAGLGDAGVNVAASVIGLVAWGAVGLGIALVLSTLAFTGLADRGPVIMGT
ncbi:MULTISPECIES: hypothetical protein [Cryobacterium]|uniref:Uncharacterized protein n=1 Tax=Cryobacterium breve TaxID=1259258 RepID=A0ABY2J7E6_9MICO|nr:MULTISPECIES: hypothetical protein [Cryobacterium]TFC92499.1 hypothetical protein E3T20_11745 [Cryobacterium sp. TmT3-12]TFC99616.1 hypothetical protein E3O65_05700 [Cryobacterium breve]